MIDLNCPYCKIELELGEDLQGELVNCPKCDESFGVPYKPEVMEIRTAEIVQPHPNQLQRHYQPIQTQPMLNQNIAVTINDETKNTIEIASWTIFIATGLLIAIPYLPTFWIWIPLWIVGLICSIIALCKAKWATGILGIMWSVMGVWIWWIVSGLIVTALFTALGAVDIRQE